MDEGPNVEIRMATLIESIRSLSAITANHDVLLTKLIDDHEQRIRLLEKCSTALERVIALEKTVHEIEIHGTAKAVESGRDIELVGSRLSTLEKIESNRGAVTSWWDKVYVRVGILVGAILGILAFIWDLWFH